MSSRTITPVDTTYLERGDYQRVADALNVSRGTVSLVATGHNKSKRIARALKALNEERRVKAKAEIDSLIDQVREESTNDIYPKHLPK